MGRHIDTDRHPATLGSDQCAPYEWDWKSNIWRSLNEWHQYTLTARHRKVGPAN